MCKDKIKRKYLLHDWKPIANPKPTLDLFALFCEGTMDRVEGSLAHGYSSW
jgi:hypothetical protein